jgi:hypothetical protein
MGTVDDDPRTRRLGAQLRDERGQLAGDESQINDYARAGYFACRCRRSVYGADHTRGRPPVAGRAGDAAAEDEIIRHDDKRSGVFH